MSEFLATTSIAEQRSDRNTPDAMSSVGGDGFRVSWGTVAPNNCVNQVHGDVELAIPGPGALVDLRFEGENPGSTVRVTDHHVSIIPANRPHSVQWLRRAHLTAFFLSPQLLCEASESMCGYASSRIMERGAALDPFLRQVGNHVAGRLRRAGSLKMFYLDSIAHLLAEHLVTNYGCAPIRTNREAGLPKHLLDRAIEFIESNLTHCLALGHIAAAVELSPFYFTRMFKRSMGTSPHRYVTYRRIERAKELLRDTQYSLSDVAAAAGFSDQSHMTCIFGRIAGTTPKSFRLSALRTQRLNHPVPAEPRTMGDGLKAHPRLGMDRPMVCPLTPLQPALRDSLAEEEK
jgi:AraC-like DNA-binding protein